MNGNESDCATVDVGRRRVLWLGPAAMLTAGLAPLRAQAPAAASQAATAIKVMSFNIRYGTAKDGDNHWDLRKALLVDVIRAENPDVIGVQEALYDQLRYIVDAQPSLDMVGVGRDDGVRAGEYAAILYKRTALALSRTDTFWFSDTPGVVGSTSWGNRITRICTWAQFTTPDGRPLDVYNVHLDHQSQPSRERSVALLRARVEARDPKAPAIVMGDFNAGEANPAIVAMREGGVFRDTFRTVHPDASPVGTFTGFTFGQVRGDKIDHVFVTDGWDVVDAAIVRTDRGQRYPSDHFPVTATLRLAGR